MKTVMIATKNPGKVKEFTELFQKYGIRVQSLLDVARTMDVEETGETFSENAILKAETISKLTGETVISDDSGLVIDALDGRPGVYSARFSGPEKNDSANIQKVLQELDGVPLENRTARFVCVLAVAVPGENTLTFEGKCEGLVTQETSGNNGFGYDPIFYLPEKAQTMAELSQQEKNKISHRAKAMKQMVENWSILRK